MAGPNLEVFKFGLYLFFPLAVMIHYGDPDWYKKNVLPLRDEFWPKEETLFKPPRNPTDLQTTRNELREARLARLNQNAGVIEGAVNKRAAAASAAASSPTTEGSSSSSSSGTSSSRTGMGRAGVADFEEAVKKPSEAIAAVRSANRDWREVDRQRLV